MGTLNGIDPAEFNSMVAEARAEPAGAQMHPQLVAEWTGGYRSRVRIADKTLEVSGPGQLDPMQLVLAALAACEIEVIATYATLMGLAIEALEIHADANFDLSTYLGLEGPPPGYDRLTLDVRLRAPGITTDQVRRLEDAIERLSPVAVSLAHGVPIEARIRTE